MIFMKDLLKTEKRLYIKFLNMSVLTNFMFIYDIIIWELIFYKIYLNVLQFVEKQPEKNYIIGYRKEMLFSERCNNLNGASE